MEKEVLLRTPIFEVARGEALPSGLRPIQVAAPDWVTIYVRRAGKVLVEKQLRFGNGKVVEELPCGMAEPGESAAEAAARELAEETGFKVDPASLVFLGSASPNPAFMTNKMSWFLADLDEIQVEEVPLKLDADEDIVSEWVDAQEFREKTLAQARAGADEIPAMLLACLFLEASARENCS